VDVDMDMDVDVDVLVNDMGAGMAPLLLACMVTAWWVAPCSVSWLHRAACPRTTACMRVAARLSAWCCARTITARVRSSSASY